MTSPGAAVKDILLAELTGTRRSNKRLARASMSIRLEVLELEDSSHAVMQRAEFAVSDASAVPDTSEPPEFTAQVTYFVELDSPYTERQAISIAEVTWPYLRSAVNDLAARMGVPYVRLPLAINESMLEAGTEAADVDAT